MTRSIQQAAEKALSQSPGISVQQQEALLEVLLPSYREELQQLPLSLAVAVGLGDLRDLAEQADAPDAAALQAASGTPHLLTIEGFLARPAEFLAAIRGEWDPSGLLSREADAIQLRTAVFTRLQELDRQAAQRQYVLEWGAKDGACVSIRDDVMQVLTLRSHESGDGRPAHIVVDIEQLSRVGRGGFGEVWPAVHTERNQRVLVKIVHPHPSHTEQLNNELLALDAQHLLLGVTRVYTADMLERVYIVMRRVNGHALSEYLLAKSTVLRAESAEETASTVVMGEEEDVTMSSSTRTAEERKDHEMEHGEREQRAEHGERGERGDLKAHQPTPSSPQPGDGLLFLQALFSAGRKLKMLHDNGLVHGDVKAQNVVINMQPGRSRERHIGPRAPVAVWVDFGLSAMIPMMATPTNPLRSTRRKIRSGTKGYIAPEIREQALFSPASDVYAFATLLLLVLRQRIPFHPRPDIHAAVQQRLALLAYTHRTPTPQPRATMDAMVEELGLVCAALERALPTTTTTPMRLPPPRQSDLASRYAGLQQAWQSRPPPELAL